MSKEQKGVWARWAALLVSLLVLGAAFVKRDAEQGSSIVSTAMEVEDHEDRLREIERAVSEIPAIKRTVDRIEQKLDQMP
jgi:hypothetical protein